MMDADATTVAGRIRLAREVMNMTQRDLAVAIGKDEAVISKWERGKNSPQKSNISLLADRLKVSREWLITGEGPVGNPSPESISEARRTTHIHHVAQGSGGVTVGGNAFITPELSASRRLALEVLQDDLRGIGEKVSEMTDEEVAELASAIRKALGKHRP